MRPARSRRCRMTAATATQTGSSEVRGNGFELSVFMPRAASVSCHARIIAPAKPDRT